MQKHAYIYAAAAVLAWATVASAFKITLRYTTYLQLLLYASIVSTITLFIFLLIQQKVSLLVQYSREEYIRSMLLGVLNPFLYYLVLFKAYSLLPAQEAQPLNWTWPIMLALLSIPLLKQKLTVISLLALGISFIGVLVISTHGNIFSLRFTNLYGVLLALGSSVIWALFWIYNVKDRRDEITKLFLNFLFGTLFILVLVLIVSKTTIPDFKGFLGSAYAGMFEMGITFVVWLRALQMSKTTAQVSNFIYATPFLSLIVIHFAVGEHILPSSIFGLVLIVTGIVIQQRSHRAASTPSQD